MCNVETEPRSGKGSPPSTQPCFYFEGSGVQEPSCNSYSCQSLETSGAGRWAGMNKHGLLGCKTWVYLLCCLCDLLWFESSQKFPRTLFSRILVWKRILAFSYPCWVDDRAAFTLHTWSVLKRRSCLQSKNRRWSQLLVTTFTQECKLMWSQPHRGWCPRVLCPPPSRQSLTALWQITYLKNRSTYETLHKFIKIKFSLFCV